MKYRKVGNIWIPQTDSPAGVRDLGIARRPGGSDVQLWSSDSAIATFGDGTGNPTAFWYASFRDWYDFRRELIQRGKWSDVVKLVDGRAVLLTERVLGVDDRLVGAGYFEIVEEARGWG